MLLKHGKYCFILFPCLREILLNFVLQKRSATVFCCMYHKHLMDMQVYLPFAFFVNMVKSCMINYACGMYLHKLTYLLMDLVSTLLWMKSTVAIVLLLVTWLLAPVNFQALLSLSAAHSFYCTRILCISILEFQISQEKVYLLVGLSANFLTVGDCFFFHSIALLQKVLSVSYQNSAQRIASVHLLRMHPLVL